MNLEADADDLERIAKTIDAIATEAVIQFDYEGMDVVVSDPPMVGMLDLHVDAALFDDFDATGGYIAVNVEDFKRFAKLVDGTVTVYTDDDGLVHVDGDHRSFTLPQLQLDMQDVPDIRDLDLGTEFDIAVDRVKAAADICKQTDNPLEVKIRDGTLVFANNNTKGNGYTEDVKQVDVDPQRALYEPTKVKQQLTALDEYGDDVHVRFDTDNPIEFTTDDDHVDVRMLIAPRIEE